MPRRTAPRTMTREKVDTALATLKAAEAEVQALLRQERGRKRGVHMRELHDLRRRLYPETYRYASQAGQDAVVDRLLSARHGGTFVDIGGHDGATGSNTLFLEVFRGWSGILVEPVCAHLEAARRIRRCPCFGLAIASTDGEADFIEISKGYTQMSGLSATYDSRLLDTVRSNPRHTETTRRVATRTLSGLLDDAGIPDPDFLSLDIEGAEIAVLDVFPFDRHRVGLWAIENNARSVELGRIMRASGHELIEFCGPDEIWRRRDL